MGVVLLFDLETGGLSPLVDRVSCVSCKVFGAESVVSFCGDFEGRLLQDFVDFVERVRPSVVVGYNAWLFDVPFLRVRCMVHGVKLPGVFWDDSCLVDPFHVLCRNKHGKQVEFAGLFGVGVVGDGRECVSLLHKGDFDKIREHCESDVRVLDEVYSRMVKSGFV
jgi:DNA polymerase III epsilon subunit-like protein